MIEMGDGPPGQVPVTPVSSFRPRVDDLGTRLRRGYNPSFNVSMRVVIFG